MTLAMTQKGPPIGEPQLHAFEMRLNLKLPSSYRKFILEVNGCKPEENYCTLPTMTGIGASARVFFGVDRRDLLDLADAKTRWTGRLPDGYLPIAESSGGNLICLSTVQRDFGAVYLWDHELEAEEDEPPSMESLHRIAPDFDEFYASLSPIAGLALPSPGKVTNVYVDEEFLAKWQQKD